ncbi:unnamed protein product [Darwinula stevensoni]|uniref:BESS domain-containing protein n=1 Tax=Darwinula stevensoni TaxID=69355 RepID=A0A7R8XKB1_9CRUS|nr:unnamed protein product [Darwinula stevensoni]CAG0892975.1 unnamed protein product [Darwinula stevensoni]
MTAAVEGKEPSSSPSIQKEKKKKKNKGVCRLLARFSSPKSVQPHKPGKPGFDIASAYQGETDETKYEYPKEPKTRQIKPPSINVASTRPTKEVHINITDVLDDEEKLYALSLAPTLKRLDPESRRIARIEIEKLLLQIEFGNHPSLNT